MKASQRYVGMGVGYDHLLVHGEPCPQPWAGVVGTSNQDHYDEMMEYHLKRGEEILKGTEL
jgi:hypothetical protein